MTAPADDSLLQSAGTPLLVGRERELAFGARLLAKTAAGRGALFLISGEAGVGKSRLTEAFTETARHMGYFALAGICQEQDRDYPFAPFVDALHQQWHDANAEGIRTLLTEQQTVFAQILPEIAPSGPIATVPLSPEQEKRRIFEAFVSFLTRLCADQPVLLTLEDLHWADATSLELLRLLPRRLAHARLLIVTTARNDEPGSAVAHWLAALQRTRTIAQLDLAPLTAADVAKMIEALTHGPVAPALAAAIHARAEGNPFLVEELVHALMDHARGSALRTNGWASVMERNIPSSVAETVGQRVEGLDTETHAVAMAASVIGRRFPFDLLATVTGRTERELVRALRSLIANYLIVEENTGDEPVFAFRHALTRDAIYHRLLGPERRQLHRTVAHALDVREGKRGSASSDDRGYHYYAAEEWGLALDHASRAGDAARAVFANTEALSHYQRALGAAQRMTATGETAVMTLAHKCATVLAILGNFDAAREQYEEALRRARRAGDLRAEERVLADLAGHYASHNYETAHGYSAAALELARNVGDDRDEALALNRLANILVNQSRFREGLARHEEALAIFERTGDRWGIADSLDGIGMAHWLIGDMPEGRACFLRALADFRAIGDRERVASCLTSGALYLGVLDGPCRYDVNPDDCLAEAEEAVTLCQEIDWMAGEIYARVCRAMAHIGRGTYGDALRELDVALEAATQIGHQQWTIITQFTRAMTLIEAHDIAGARAVLEPAGKIADAMGGVQWAPRIAVWLLRCDFLLGQRADVEEALRPFLPSGERPEALVQRRALFLLGECALRRGNPARVISITRRLSLPPRPGLPLRDTPATLMLRADALVALDQIEEARRALEEARTLATVYGPRGMLWRISAGLAALKKRAGRPDQDERIRARIELQTLLDGIGEEHLRNTLLQTPHARAVMSVSAVPHDPNGLSLREVEVLRLIAGGQTNQEIAATLFLSVRTVERHITSLYRKINVNGRADATAYAIHHRLLEDTRLTF